MSHDLGVGRCHGGQELIGPSSLVAEEVRTHALGSKTLITVAKAAFSA